MKIFEKNGKINFVDDNNMLIGFDYGQECCEDFGYFFSREYPTVAIMTSYSARIYGKRGGKKKCKK